MRKILVAFDGSDSAVRATRHAAALSQESNQITLLLLHVVDPTMMGTDPKLWQADPQGRYMAEAQQVLEAAVQILNEVSAPHESLVRLGSPGDEIAAVARDTGCQAIIMGTRGLSPVASVFIGSVAHRVIQLTDVPVTLVK